MLTGWQQRPVFGSGFPGFGSRSGGVKAALRCHDAWLARETARCQAVIVSKSMEQSVAAWLIIGVFAAWFLLAVIASAWPWEWKRMPGVPVITAVMAYSFYVAAALYGGAAFPGFLREHLFDGLAPAAVVGLLVNSIPTERPETAFPWIRRPVMILVVFYAGGALIFGLIAAAAVFASGTDDFTGPIALCAFFGGALFPLAYYLDANPDTADSWSRLRWWFGKRPKDEMPEPSGPREAAVPAPADAAEGSTAPRGPSGDLRASPDASQESR